MHFDLLRLSTLSVQYMGGVEYVDRDLLVYIVASFSSIYFTVYDEFL